jgi:hypothetical protein
MTRVKYAVQRPLHFRALPICIHALGALQCLTYLLTDVSSVVRSRQPSSR